jgi:cytoskeletal protein CcmA (bactofilin family)
MNAANDSAFVFIEGMEIVGDVTLSQDVIVQGRIDGFLKADNVRVAKSACVSGTIVADTVEVFGAVADGAILANRIALRAGCDVDADLYYRDLDVDAGALFEGKSRKHHDPHMLAQPPIAAE